jgi:hypothetical protein
MTLKKTDWSVAIAVLIVTVIALCAILSSQSYQECVRNPAHEYRKDSILKQFATFFVCSGNYVTLNQGPIAALGAFITAIFTGTLWWSTRKLWDASERQIKLAETTAARQLRAYVVCDGVDVRSLVIDGKWTWHFSLKWSNQGSTPTHNLAMFAKAKRFKGPTDDPSFPTADNVEPVRGLIGPKGEAYSGPAAIDHDIMLKMAKEDWRFFIWGVVKYEDVFWRKHVTMTCLRMDLKSTNWEVPKQDQVVRCPGIPYKKWNGADDECDRYSAELATLPDLPD